MDAEKEELKSGNRYLSPGTRVRLDGGEHGPEFGVVVYCWMSDEIQDYDCYVAFFGFEGIPSGKPLRRPYVFRYASTSLAVIG